jgi:hypothetical protein
MTCVTLTADVLLLRPRSFVFLWTPALSPNGEKIPHGMIFACFMTASMVRGCSESLFHSTPRDPRIACPPVMYHQVGSSLSPILMRRYKIEAYMKYVFGAAALSLAVPFLFHLDLHPDKNGKQGQAGEWPRLSCGLLLPRPSVPPRCGGCDWQACRPRSHHAGGQDSTCGLLRF